MKYKLRVRCEIQQTDDDGGYYGPGLTVEETVDLDAVDFMEIAGISGRFHDLAEEINARRVKSLANGHTTTCTCPDKYN